MSREPYHEERKAAPDEIAVEELLDDLDLETVANCHHPMTEDYG